MKKHNELRSTPLFQGLSEDLLETISRKALLRTYRAGEAVVNEEDPVRSLSVVLDGQVKLSKSSAEGREQTLTLLGPGDPFGLCTAFASNDFPASAVTLKKTTILTIPGSAVEDIVRQEPMLLLNIIRVLSLRLKETMRLVESLALKEIPQRVASFILHDLAKQDTGSQCSLELAITHRELAKIIGATPEALSRALKKMSEDGLLRVDGRMITVYDRKALKELADGG
ncbi:MAG TPA: Crp/Fnr family transcriptional regulator [Deltaproteobacteria bacterium]|jgi:CRP/FNR family transcriptional regulator|nr:Crp/Fnr family transcriptional regulator [Deltaproteobacteria bacterium]OQC27776.1 MAG: cAMP receptor protein [Deltaproteobacteria bacterium ADurb.Bin072]HRW79956.1 Crp/Fnr family transcriptional regulator [Desulfomonilia bacterium]HNQ84635.1 Crp/Fnr family transcriptional regulator [Deltaproteobacteria bacterium]HNS88535.1 Crp/Fnr family transcriptional regulator [Deltaproteobacteria bacterium]